MAGKTINGIKSRKAVLFDSYGDAKRAYCKGNGKEIIFRTEDRQDYNGASGLRNSPNSHMEDGGFFNRYFKMGEEGAIKRLMELNDSVARYCLYSGESLAKYNEGFSLSYWKYVDGVHFTISADSAINGRYHVFFTDERIAGYASVENSKITYLTCHKELPAYVLNALVSIPRHYDAVLNLDRFAGNHCYIMEGTFAPDGIYPLQMLRGRDFEPATFELGSSNKGHAQLVRGATKDEQGIVCNTTVIYADEHNPSASHSEEASFDKHNDFTFTEAMVRNRKVQFIDMAYLDLGSEMKHPQISKFLKPQISVLLKSFIFFGADEILKMRQKMDKCEANIEIPLRIICDGKRGLVERI